MIYLKLKVISVDNEKTLTAWDTFGECKLYPKNTIRTIKAFTFSGIKTLKEKADIKYTSTTDIKFVDNIWELIK